MAGACRSADVVRARSPESRRRRPRSRARVALPWPPPQVKTRRRTLTQKDLKNTRAYADVVSRRSFRTLRAGHAIGTVELRVSKCNAGVKGRGAGGSPNP